MAKAKQESKIDFTPWAKNLSEADKVLFRMQLENDDRELREMNGGLCGAKQRRILSVYARPQARVCGKRKHAEEN